MRYPRVIETRRHGEHRLVNGYRELQRPTPTPGRVARERRERESLRVELGDHDD